MMMMTEMTTERHMPSGASAVAARLIRQLLTLAGPTVELVQATEREWASATFSGARHAVTLRIPLDHSAAAAPAFIAGLPDHEFDLPGQIVADCVVTLQQRTLDPTYRTWLAITIELLTIGAD